MNTNTMNTNTMNTNTMNTNTMNTNTVNEMVQEICNRNGAIITRNENPEKDINVVDFSKGGLDWSVVISERLLDKQVNSYDWEICTFGGGFTPAKKEDWLAYALETIEKAMTDPSAVGVDVTCLMIDDNRKYTALFSIKCNNWFNHQDVFRKQIDSAIDIITKEDDDDDDDGNVDDFLTSIGL